MKSAALSRPRLRLGHRECALGWLSIATLLLGLRAAFFGVLMSPTLNVLLGVADQDPLGPLPANDITLDDPLLILAALFAIAMAARHGICYLRGRQ